MREDGMEQWAYWLRHVLVTEALPAPGFEVTDQIVDELVREIEAFLAEQGTEGTDGGSEEE